MAQFEPQAEQASAILTKPKPVPQSVQRVADVHAIQFAEQAVHDFLSAAKKNPDLHA